MVSCTVPVTFLALSRYRYSLVRMLAYSVSPEGMPLETSKRSLPLWSALIIAWVSGLVNCSFISLLPVPVEPEGVISPMNSVATASSVPSKPRPSISWLVTLLHTWIIVLGDTLCKVIRQTLSLLVTTSLSTIESVPAQYLLSDISLLSLSAMTQ